MSIEKPTSWETYEDVARLLLDKVGDALRLGFESTEGNRHVSARRAPNGKSTLWASVLTAKR
ncbi:hypothetical protein BKG84_02500 [Mycobacteroides chelonae]|uniref:Uncharacterized protein n=1 Tax=Mycobacteroides chelonae TaxID=1774 RepID=A0A1S1M690_MYCCH|nr:hypothetical protein BKG84_02500 [Mycobacteroides chelonae]